MSAVSSEMVKWLQRLPGDCPISRMLVLAWKARSTGELASVPSPEAVAMDVHDQGCECLICTGENNDYFFLDEDGA